MDTRRRACFSVSGPLSSGWDEAEGKIRLGEVRASRGNPNKENHPAYFPSGGAGHHRQFISDRRGHRPSEEYRESTDSEWLEFRDHFSLRKVALGNFHRPYGPLPARTRLRSLPDTAARPRPSTTPAANRR